MANTAHFRMTVGLGLGLLQYDTIIGVTSYGALGHVPPLELGHVKKIWQFLR